MQEMFYERINFNQYRIIFEENDYFVAEASSFQSAVKKVFHLKKNLISQNFKIDQEVFLKVEYINDLLLLPLANPTTLLEIAALQHEESLRIDNLAIDKALALLDQGVADSFEIEGGGIIAACKNEHLAKYKKIRLKRIRNLNELINFVDNNNGHPDYPKHETNPEFMRLCNLYLTSIFYEKNAQEINIDQHLSATSAAKQFLLFAKINEIRNSEN